MNRKDKETKDKIKNKLDEFEIACPLPLELSKENVTEMLRQQPAPAKNRARIVQIRRAASAAAAIVVVFGAMTAFGLFGGSSGLQKVLDTIKGNTVTGNTAGIETAASEKQIIELFKKMSKDDTSHKNYFSFDGFFGSKDEMAAAESAPGAQNGAAADASTRQGSYGETNVQVKGIDEPDVMKNDGKYLYTVSNNEVNIYSILPADSMKLASSVKFANSTGKSEYPNALFVKGDLLVVFSTENTYIPYDKTTQQPGETKPDETVSAAEPGSGQNSPGSEDVGSVEPQSAAQAPDEQVKNSAPDIDYYYRGYYDSRSASVCTIYNISNREAPKQIKRMTQDGSFISARLIGSELYVLSSYYVNIYAQTNLENICIPAVAVDGKSENIPAADISITKNPEPSYLVVCGINLDDLNAEPDKKAVLGGGSEAYCTADSLFASRTVYAGGSQTRDWGGDIAVIANNYSYSTEIYRFAIGGGKVEFKNSGKVNGQILNQFSMDEYNGYFRIATTSGDWNETSSNVFVLNDKLEVVGKVENIAPKERIFAVRFMGETAYVVTFEQTDPLFVLNLSDPKAPKIIGELKLPGFSSYLHPVTDTLLLGIGQNGNESGTTPGIKLSLFDVSDPANPKEIDKLVIEGNCSSEAMNNHKAFMVYPEKGLFGIPVLKYNNYLYYSEPAAQDGSASDGSSSSTVTSFGGPDYMVSSFETYTVQGGKIVPVMSYKENNKQSADSYYYYGGITRGTYVDNTIYTLSASALTSFNMASGSTLDSLAITQPTYNYYDYGYGTKEPIVID